MYDIIQHDEHLLLVHDKVFVVHEIVVMDEYNQLVEHDYIKIKYDKQAVKHVQIDQQIVHIYYQVD